MKYSIAVAAFASLICTSDAFAEIVTVEYVGKVSDIYEGSNGSVKTSNQTGFVVSVGDNVTATFAYDTTAFMYRENWTWPYIQRFLYNGADMALDFSKSGDHIASATSTVITAEYNPWSLIVDAFGLTATGGEIVLSHSYQEPYSPLLGYMPNADLWKEISKGFTNLSYFPQGKSNYDQFVALEVSSVRVISSVPEPATYAMFAFGALVLLDARRRMKS